MSRASTEMEEMRQLMVRAVELMSPEDVKAMLLASVRLANTFEMRNMAAATSFESFEKMEWELL